MTWILDDKGNRCSVEYWGSEEKAREALASLKGCSYCTDCTGCRDCWNCRDCSNCTGCSYCSNCTGCSYCTDCRDCRDCTGCSNCSNCSNCTGCTGCRDCWNRTADGRTEPVDVPVVADLHNKLHEAVSHPEALNMSAWHTCATTHCRAGWVVTLAGEQGKALEGRFDTLLAAQMIYDASCPGYKINPCRFFDSDEDALKDIKALAEATS